MPTVHQQYEGSMPPPATTANMSPENAFATASPQQAAGQSCGIALVRIDDLPSPQGQQLADRIRARLCSQGGEMTGVEDGHHWTAFRAGQTPPPRCTITNIHIDDLPYPQGQAIADAVRARLCADPSLPLEGTEQGHRWTATRAS